MGAHMSYNVYGVGLNMVLRFQNFKKAHIFSIGHAFPPLICHCPIQLDVTDYIQFAVPKTYYDVIVQPVSWPITDLVCSPLPHQSRFLLPTFEVKGRSRI